MREELTEVDLLTEIKKNYMEKVRTVNLEEIKRKAEKEQDTITLYHGTSTNRLNSILREGILPRKETGIDNWKWDGDGKSSKQMALFLCY